MSHRAGRPFASGLRQPGILGQPVPGQLTLASVRLPNALLLGGAAAVLGCAAAPAIAASPLPHGRGAERPLPRGLDLGKLGALSNYRAELVDGSSRELFVVHSPTDWETFTGGPYPASVNVAGSEYARQAVISGTHVSFEWKRLGPAESYRDTPYPGYASGFARMTHVTGVKLVHGARCRDAGVAGTTWRFAAARRGAAYPRVAVCVADRSGVMLQYVEGAIDLTTRSFVTSFEITGIGDVRAIPVPKGGAAPGATAGSPPRPQPVAPKRPG